MREGRWYSKFKESSEKETGGVDKKDKREKKEKKKRKGEKREREESMIYTKKINTD